MCPFPEEENTHLSVRVNARSLGLGEFVDYSTFVIQQQITNMRRIELRFWNRETDMPEVAVVTVNESGVAEILVQPSEIIGTPLAAEEVELSVSIASSFDLDTIVQLDSIFEELTFCPSAFEV